MKSEAATAAKVLVVDDDEFMRDMFKDALVDHYQLVFAECGEDALELAQTECPDLILLDVEMPGIDGYETCRRLKQIDAMVDIPVIFVSGHDLIEDRLAGYEAGGEDYMTKPFDQQELKAKVARLLSIYAEHSSLKQSSSYASNMAMTVMTSMSEMGSLLEAMKCFNACVDYKALADAVLTGFTLYELKGVVQIRSPQGILTRNHHGEATPLEISVIQHMASMERIVQFKARMSITYDHVSLLVINMPVEDPDRCGRLRDHLAVLAEAAEARVRGITDGMESLRRGAAIEQAIGQITETLKEIDSIQRQNRTAINLRTLEIIESMDRAFVSLGLTQSQEEHLSSLIKKGIDDILDILSTEADIQDKLTSITKELKIMLGAS